MTQTLPAADSGAPAPIAVLMKGYPRLSETFIAQEILALERLGFRFEIWAMRRPTDGAVHPMHRQIAAPVRYLPEYLHKGVGRVLAGAWNARRRPGFKAFLSAAWADLRRDPTADRMRRIGQALVMARELADAVPHIHVHFLHTPASVARYAAILTGRRFTFSAHAKDIWTTSDWDKGEKIAGSAWGVTCTRTGLDELRRLAPANDPGRVALAYHGLDLDRFPVAPERAGDKDGSDPARPVEIVSVGRAVAKKGYDDLLAALALLPPHLHWRFTHVGAGDLLAELKAEAGRLGLSERIDWRGALPQDEVVAALRAADLFVLACKEGEKGDRDGLPNVIMEAASQKLPIVSTRFAGVPEFVEEGSSGLLVPPSDPAALGAALDRLIGDPQARGRLGEGAHTRLRSAFALDAGIRDLQARFARILDEAGAPIVRP